MKLTKIDFSKFSYPLKVLLEGNTDTWYSLLSVIEDLTPQQLVYKHPNYAQRCIAEMINHALDTQYGFYTQNLVLGQSYQPLYADLPGTVTEAQKRIAETFAKTVEVWKSLQPKDFIKEIKTEWGQTLAGELALFQSNTHTHYHVSEVCFLRGLGGFPTKVMG